MVGLTASIGVGNKKAKKDKQGIIANIKSLCCHMGLIHAPSEVIESKKELEEVKEEPEIGEI